MLNDHLQIYTLSIVFVGDFNPVIIQPYWLAIKKLIREQEAATAKLEIAHAEIVKFELDWLYIEVTKDRFELRTSQEPYFEPVKDLAIGIFNILSETPVRQVGINHLKYFALPDKDRYYKFGDKITPLNNWSDSLQDPKVLMVEVYEKNRKDGNSGHVRVRIQPSDITLSTEFGVLININDHININENQTGRDGEILRLFASVWSESFDRVNTIVENIWQKVNT